MTSVSIAELKSRLSYYLRRVQRGEGILVRNRQQVVARLEPAGGRAEEATDRVSRLEQAGVLRRGERGLDATFLRQRPKVRADVVQALIDERNEGR